jgi:hypothetical protein
MKWPMLTRRGVTFYHRQVVPLALRPFLDNRREIWKSLRTTDLEEAKLLSLRVGQEVARLFQSLRKKAAAAQADPDTFGRDFKTSADHNQMPEAVTAFRPTRDHSSGVSKAASGREGRVHRAR